MPGGRGQKINNCPTMTWSCKRIPHTTSLGGGFNPVGKDSQNGNLHMVTKNVLK